MAIPDGPRPRVFFDIKIGDTSAGRLTIELFTDKAPKTCENFRALCAGSNPPLTYKNSPFHRVIDEFMIQGGDITNGDGTGGDSIYGGEFEDENLGWRDIDHEGLVCMANRGKDTNSSQFFITLAPSEHLNGKHTIFGHLASGADVLERVAAVDVDKRDRPKAPVLITHCGELERRKKAPGEPSTRRPEITQTASYASSRLSSDGEALLKRRRRSSSPHSSSSSSSSTHSSRSRSRSRTPSRNHPSHSPSRGRNRPSPPDSPAAIPAPAKRARRRSEHSVDETLRGRTRQRNHARHASATSPINEEEAAHEDEITAPPARGHRHRNPSPSRGAREDGSADNGWRRRRSLPNHYERRRGAREEESLREEEARREGDAGERFRDAIVEDVERAAPKGPKGWTGGIEGGDGGSGAVKFKGRGLMKYKGR